jgi:hypothetical protein
MYTPPEYEPYEDCGAGAVLEVTRNASKNAKTKNFKSSFIFVRDDCSFKESPKIYY